MPINLRRADPAQLKRLQARASSFDETDAQRRRALLELGLRVALSRDHDLWDRWHSDLRALEDSFRPGVELLDALHHVSVAEGARIADAAVHLSEVLEHDGHIRFAIAVLEDATARLEDEMGRDVSWAAVRAHLGRVLIRRPGTVDEGIEMLLDAADQFAWHDRAALRGRCLVDAALAMSDEDRPHALGALEEAERAFEHGHFEAWCFARLHRARLLLDAADAATALDLALGTTPSAPLRVEALRHEVLAEALARLGFHREALVQASEAKQAYERLGEEADAAHCQQLEVQLAAEFGTIIEHAVRWFDEDGDKVEDD